MNWDIKTYVKKLGGLLDIDDMETARLRRGTGEIVDLDGNEYSIPKDTGYYILDYDRGYVMYGGVILDWLKPIPLPVDEIEDHKSIVWSFSYNMIRPALIKQLLVDVEGVIYVKVDKDSKWFEITKNDSVDLTHRYGTIYAVLDGKAKLHTRPISIGRW